MKYALFGLLVFIQLLLPATAQLQTIDRVLFRPKCMDAPKSDGSTDRCRGEEGTEYWTVISDRARNYSYKAPSDDAEKMTNPLDFGDYFYVVETRGEWLHVISSPDLIPGKKGKITGGTIDDRGWVRRSDVLLWNSALQNPSTAIHLKVFSAFTMEEVEQILKEHEREKKDVLKIFASPNGSETLSEPTIYQFYFVYKIENDRYLIGTEYKLPSSSIRRTLLGWVLKSRVIAWETRVAMEPNFEPEAFEERRENEGFQLVAYREFTAATSHARTAQKQGGIIWNQDPVLIKDEAEMAKTNPRRFKGSVIRFPLLGFNTEGGANYFETGLIGDIKIRTTGKALDSMGVTQYSVIEERLDNLLSGKQNMDVMFLVEGSLSMAEYRSALKEAIPEIIKKLPSHFKVRVGMALYRDSPVGEKDLFEIRDLKTDAADLQTFIANARFEKMGDNDDWTALYYGLDNALAHGDFSPQHTNVIFVVGNFGDLSRSASRKRDAELQGDATVKITRENLVERLATLDVHLFAIQPKQLTENTAADAFGSQMCNLIQQSATTQQQKYVNIYTGEKLAGNKDEEPLPIANPVMPNPTTDKMREDFKLEGGSTVGRFVRAAPGKAISKTSTINILGECIESVVDFQKTLETALTRIIRGEALDKISVGALEREAIQKILQSVAGSEENLKNLTREKYKFYTTAFFPEKITAAQHSAFSYVLFMPEDDVRIYLQSLRRISNARLLPPDQQREALYETLVELVRTFSGNRTLGIGEADDVYIQDLYNKYMQGISDRGLNLFARLGVSRNFRIEDIKSSKKVKDPEVVALVRSIDEHTEKLREIQSQGRKHEFAYKSGDEWYFWIPIEYTF